MCCRRNRKVNAVRSKIKRGKLSKHSLTDLVVAVFLDFPHIKAETRPWQNYSIWECSLPKGFFKDNPVHKNVALNCGAAEGPDFKKWRFRRGFLKHRNCSSKITWFLPVLFHFSGEVFGPERLGSHRPDSSDSHQWILHRHRYSCRNCFFLVDRFRGAWRSRSLSSICVPSDEDMDQSDASPDFYINVCQPLNPIPGVTCPPGAAVCMDPDNGPPVVRLTNAAGYFDLTFQTKRLTSRWKKDWPMRQQIQLVKSVKSKQDLVEP